MDDRREGSRRKKESRIWRRQGGRDEEKGFPLGWMKARENFPIPFPCSLFIVSGHNERYIQSSSRAYFWETRLNVYSQLRNRVGNALCCSSKAKEEKRTGMRNKKMKWHLSEDGLVKRNVLGNSTLSSLYHEDRDESCEERIFIHFLLAGTLKRYINETRCINVRWSFKYVNPLTHFFCMLPII